MGLIPTKRHSSVVPPSLLSLRIPEVLCHHQVLFLLHDSLGHSEHQPKSPDLTPLIAHSSCSAVCQIVRNKGVKTPSNFKKEKKDFLGK